MTNSLYFAGNEFNDKDLILQRLSHDEQNEVIVELKTVANAAHPVGTFNIQIEKI